MKRHMELPIIMAAFGTSTRALDTYEYIDNIVRSRFPKNEIIWAYSSRMVKDILKKKKNIALRHPHEVLAELEKNGHTWAVVQSMHLICGHEFYRLIDEAQSTSVRTGIGLPLLTSPKDYRSVTEALMEDAVPKQNVEAVVMVGHGTDHPGWSTYMALSGMFRKKYGSHIFFGVVEGYPEVDDIVEAVKHAGFQKVCLVPFMLVAGVHFFEDLAGEEESYKAAFEEQGIEVTLKKNGIGMNDKIIDIFCKHIEDAIDIIPL